MENEYNEYEDDYIDDYYDSNEYDYYDDYNDYDETEEYESTENKKNFYINKKIIIILFLILIFILISFIVIKNTNNREKTKTKDIKQQETISKKKLNNTFNMIKTEVLNYYNENNFDKNNNKLTLKEMKELGLISKIDKIYNINKSMINIYSINNNYKLKIILYYKKRKDMKVYDIGKYIYCKDTYLCEKSSSEEKKQYEYFKDGDKKLSSWSNWTENTEITCDVNKIECPNDAFDCLEERKITIKEIDNDNDIIYGASRLAFETIGKEIINGCINYDYVKINGSYYRVNKNSNFKVLGNIKKDTVGTYYNWKYNGRKSYYNPPNDTINTRYVYVSADYSNCSDTCETHPRYIYDSYTFMSQFTKVDNPINDCKIPELKLVPNYSIESQDIKVARKEKTKVKKCYSSTRKRSIINNKITKWSKYNDKKLLDNNYNYTGNSK